MSRVVHPHHAPKSAGVEHPMQCPACAWCAPCAQIWPFFDDVASRVKLPSFATQLTSHPDLFHALSLAAQKVGITHHRLNAALAACAPAGPVPTLSDIAVPSGPMYDSDGLVSGPKDHDDL